MAAPAPPKPVARPAPSARIRPYKDFLTPALHRAFTNAALVGLGVCWINAVFMAKPSLFWSWFPLGITGVRTGLLFISSLTIFILRVAYMHVGARMRSSDLGSIVSILASKRAMWTCIWYWVSAFLFSETYIFSTNSSSNLAWVDSARSYERPRLNERAVLFRTMFGILALVQAALHLLRDYDTLDLLNKDVQTDPPSQDSHQLPTRIALPPSLRHWQKSLPKIAIRSLALVFEVGVFGPLVYFILLRGSAWTISLRIAKVFYTIQKSQSPTGLSDIFSLFARYLLSSLLLVLSWEITNTAFTTYVTQAPLRKGQPLTNDSTKPNESLVDGLKAKREIPHAMAFWELQLIAEQFEVRRKAIFNDVEKPGTSTWLDVLECCLAEIQSVSSSIKRTLTPPTAAPVPSSEPQQPPKPRLTRPLKENSQIYSPTKRPTTTFDALAEGVGAVAKSLGQSPSSSPITSKARAYLDPPPGQSTPSHSLTTTIQSYTSDLLRTPIGQPFRLPFSERINAIIFNHPHSNAANIHHAIRALARLTIHSLREDNFGQVQKDVPRIIRALGTAVADVQMVARALPPHWTDVWFDDAQRSRVPEVQALLGELRAALEEILLHFGEYASALGISREELRWAKGLVGKGEEMTMQVAKR